MTGAADVKITVQGVDDARVLAKAVAAALAEEKVLRRSRRDRFASWAGDLILWIIAFALWTFLARHWGAPHWAALCFGVVAAYLSAKAHQ